MSSKVDHYRIHANPPALGWNTHPDSGGMVYAVKMYSFRQLQCTLSYIQYSLYYEFPIKPVCNLYNFNNEQVIFKVEIPILLL